MKVITAAQAKAALDYGELVESMRLAHQGPRSATDDVYMEEPDLGYGPNGFLVRPAWQYGKHIGTKLASVFPENPDRGMLTVHAVYVLFDGRNGTPLAVMDGTVLTWFKTACDSALGASFLAREDAAHLTMVGAGAMAPHLIKAHLAVRPSITRVSIWNRTSARANDLAESLKLRDVAVDVTEDLSAAVRDSDIISVATRSPYGVIAGVDLAPGTHLDLVGAYTPDMREVDDTAIRRGKMFVDLVETAMLTGELLQPIAAGVMTEDDIVADLYQLAQGDKPGRQSDEEITIFKNGGGGHLDLMTAEHILAKLE
jgi:ornithine cyclodeaminase